MRDLYAVAATRWVEEGRIAQYVLVPASEPDLVRAWSRLAFGQQHVHGVRTPLAATSPTATGLVVRRATRDDVPALARLDEELPLHQGLAPTFSAGNTASLAERLAEWEADIDLPQYGTFVAERDGKVLGSAVGCALELSSSHTGLARPENAALMGFAAVFPDARGSGAGRRW
jgi:hypothetical protein